MSRNKSEAEGATMRLARWAAQRSSIWATPSLDGAINAFTDTIAVMMAGARYPALRQFADAILQLGGDHGPASVAGSRLSTGAPWAALINGAAAHYLDFDDVLDPSMSHPSAVLVPAVLALGETLSSSGADCLDAYLVGLEVLARLGEAMNLPHYANGWHATSTLGSIAAAAACARLQRLDATRFGMAMSLGTSMAGGSKRQFGTFAKPMHAGMAAKNGIVAAHMAAAGVEAIEEPLEGNWGYMELTCGDTAPGFNAALDKLGKVSAMQEHGVSVKLYPCCSSTHRPIDALLDLLASEQLDARDVLHVDAAVSEIAARNLRYSRPATPAQARFSLHYCLAVTLHAGRGPVLKDFDPESVPHPDIQALLPRIDMRIDAARASRGPIAESSDTVSVTLRLRDGRQISKSLAYPKGHPKRPMDDGTLRGKYDMCLDGVPAQADGRLLWEKLRALPDITHIGDVTTHLRWNAA